VSFQSQLTDDIAEELAAEQRSISVAEFFEKNKHMLGFDSPARGLVTAVKEGVDNSLTWGTPFVYREDGETRHGRIGEFVDRVMEENRDEVVEERGGDLQKLRIGSQEVESLSFDDGYDVGFKNVSTLFRHRVNSDIYRITVEGGHEVELTDYHSVFVLREGEVVSVKTDEVTEDDYIVAPETGWSPEETVEEINLVEELLELRPEETQKVEVYGIEDLLDEHRDEILGHVKADYRISDFRKCDRLPLNLVRELDLSPEEFKGREVGYRFGKSIPAVLPVTQGLTEMLGVYVAEGCVTGVDTGYEKTYISLGSHENELVEHVESLAEEVFGLEASTVDAHDTAINVTLNASIVGLVIKEVFNAGTRADEKRIPRFVFDLDDRKKESFVLGYGAGDGYPTEGFIDAVGTDASIEEIDRKRLTFSTASERLSSGLRYLLSSLGFRLTHETREGGERDVNGTTAEFGGCSLLHLRTDRSQTYDNRLPADHILDEVRDAKLSYNLEQGRQERVVSDNALALADGGKVTFKGEAESFARNDLTALPVEGIEKIEYDKEWVYDLSVPGYENFMAGTYPVACHNSLDACEEAGALPDILVGIEEVRDGYRLVIEDNGPGIVKRQIPKIFGKLLYGSRFGKRVQSLAPDQRLLVRRDGRTEFIPIGVLCDAYLPEDGEGVRPIDGIEVPSFNRETHEMSWEPVTTVIRHETQERMYEITTEKGRTVEVTGNHSLFCLTEQGETKELDAGELEPGDTVLAPRKLPTPEETVEEVNLLNHIDREQLEGRRVYVYGFDREMVGKIRAGEKIRKKPSEDSDRKRTYYRYDGVDILKDSLEANYLKKGYLPAETVLELGWEQKASDCSLRTYQVGGDETDIPVSVPLNGSFAKLLGYYISEGHAGDRQVGFTFGSHEDELIEATERAVATVGGGTTTVERERNSTRVKAFGSPLCVFLENVCGEGAENKRVPGFVFEAPSEFQQRFIAALYEGDGSDSHPANELSHTTTSEALARQLSVLWNMQGVVASTEEHESTEGYADRTTTMYRTKVYGEDTDLCGVFEEKTDTGEQNHKRIPTSVLDEIRVGDGVERATVPDSIPGLLMGAGVGSSLEHAAVYASLIEDSLDGEYVDKPWYVSKLKKKGLLNDDHKPTDRLRSLWEAVQNLHGFTDTDMCLLPVKSVEETEPPEYVYDISVPGETGYDENFVVANEGALSVKNSRGQQGIGISAAVLYAQLTSGKPAIVTSKTQTGEAQRFEVVIDTDTNEPEIVSEEEVDWDRTHGTRIEIEMEANMRARSQLHDYFKNTAVVNPHARLRLREPDEEFSFDRATDELPEEPSEIKPHPHGVELGTLIRLLESTDSYSVRGFVSNEFTRVGGKTADSILAGFRDRLYGREAGWSPPRSYEDDDGLVAVVTEAVANKPADATREFAEAVADGIEGHDVLTRTAVRSVVEETAESNDERFGDTVRGNVVEAVWDEVVDAREDDLYRVLDGATTDRKDETAVRDLAERLAGRFDDADDTMTREALEEAVNGAGDGVEEVRDERFGEKARENITDGVWERMETVERDTPSTDDVAGDRDVARYLLNAMRATDVIAPPTDCLSPIGRDDLEAGLRKEYDAEFYGATTRDASVHGGDPFVVEAGIAYGGSVPAEGDATLLRFANRVPLVYQQGACAITDTVGDIGWKNYGLDETSLPQGPAVIAVHIASTNVPFTSESKDAVANVPEIEDEIERAVREVARELKSHIKKTESRKKRRKKERVVANLLPQMAEKVAEVTERQTPSTDTTLARILNKVTVEAEGGGDGTTVRVENNSDRKQEFEVHAFVDDEVEMDGEANVVDLGDEFDVVWDVSVGKGDEASLDVPAEASVTVDGIDEEIVEVVE